MQQNSDAKINVLAPFNPTSDDAQAVGLRLLQLRSDDVFFDIGCGDGRVLIAAIHHQQHQQLLQQEQRQSIGTIAQEDDICTGTEQRTRLRCVGIEIDFDLYTKAVTSVKELVSQQWQDRIDIRHEDVLVVESQNVDAAHSLASLSDQSNSTLLDDPIGVNFTYVANENVTAAIRCSRSSLSLYRDCTAVYLYLLPHGLIRLQPILDRVVSERRRKHRLGAGNVHNESLPVIFRVVTYMFQMHGWSPTTVDRTSRASAPVYLYEFRLENAV